MRSVEIMREELGRYHVVLVLPIEQRRRIVKIAKRARRKGVCPRSAIGQELTKLLAKKI